jgi:Domain of unknown function (DUF4253)
MRRHSLFSAPGSSAHPSAGPEIALPTAPPPPGMPGPLPAAGPLRIGGISLGPGRAVAARHRDGAAPSATLWVTDTVVPEADAAWAALAAGFPTTGLWPLLLQSLDDGWERPWDSGEFDPASDVEIDAIDPRAVLEDGWRGSLVPIDDPWAPGTGPLAPFHPDFPGLAPSQPPSDEVLLAPAGGSARIGLVSCRRPADSIGVAGWQGAINVRRPDEVSAVLRSWEERLGAMVVGLGFATVTLLVTRPPRTDGDALRVAAEVAALCPDALWQPEEMPPYLPREATLDAMARHLVRASVWRLWFD